MTLLIFCHIAERSYACRMLLNRTIQWYSSNRFRRSFRPKRTPSRSLSLQSGSSFELNSFYWVVFLFFVQVPKVFGAINYEAELGVVIGKKCSNVSPDQAMNYVAGFCLALDMTGMDFILDARPKGLPWCLGKGFDTSTPVSRLIAPEELGDPNDVRVWCKVNDQLKQDDRTSNLIFTVSCEFNHLLWAKNSKFEENLKLNSINWMECCAENF